MKKLYKVKAEVEFVVYDDEDTFCNNVANEILNSGCCDLTASKTTTEELTSLDNLPFDYDKDTLPIADDDYGTIEEILKGQQNK